MSIIQNFAELILLLIILGGSLPLCLYIALGWSPEHKTRVVAHFLLLLFTAWSILEVSTSLLLGLFNQLNLQAVIALNIPLFLIGLLILYKRSPYPPIGNLFRFSSISNRTELLVLGSIAFVGFVLAATLATEPITDFDSLWFHLPAIARWYQTGSLSLLDPLGSPIFKHPDALFYPYNWHILSVLFVLPFREDFLVALPMLIAWVLLGLAIYGLGVEWGATRLHAMAGATLVLTMPMLLNQVNTIHIDLPLAAFFAVGLYLAVSYHKTRSSVELALFLASLGMLAGIKTPGIIYSAFLVGILVALEIRKVLWDKSPLFSDIQSVLNPLVAVGILLCLFLGGFWYVRNLGGLHNQIADSFAIKVASIGSYTLSKTPNSNELGSRIYELQRSTLTHQFNPTNPFHWRTLGIQSLTRLQLPFLAMMVQVALLPIALVNGQNKIRRIGLIQLSALLLCTGFLYWNTPYSSGASGYEPGELSPLFGYNIRYGFPFFAVLGAVAATTATAFSVPGRLVGAIVCLSSILGILSNGIFDAVRRQNFTGDSLIWASALLNDIRSSHRIVDWISEIIGNNLINLLIFMGVLLGLTLLTFIVLSNSTICLTIKDLISKTLGKNNRVIVGLVCIGLIATATWMAREERDAQRAEVYRGIYTYLESNIKKDEKIAYFSSHRNYLFYGKHLDKTVLHVPIDLEHPYHWLDYLKQNKVSLIATGPGFNSKVEDWLTKLSDEQLLQPAFGSDAKNQPALYRLKTLPFSP